MSKNSTPETADKKLFSELYRELAPKFLDYEHAQNIFKKLIDVRHRCLELGLGTGMFAAPLINEGYDIDGLEPKGHMLGEMLRDEEVDKFTTCVPRVYLGKAQDFEYDKGHNHVVSHSGPLFFVRDNDQLFLEGLRHDQVQTNDMQKLHDDLLQKILVGVHKHSGSLLLNIQEDRTNILLKNETIRFDYNRVGEYDVQNRQVRKHGRFVRTGDETVLQADQYQPYDRYACTYDQIEQFLCSIGDISMEIHDKIWVKITPEVLNSDIRPPYRTY